MSGGAAQGNFMQFSASRAFSDAFQRLGARFGLLVGIWLLFFVAIIGVFAAFGGVVFTMMRQTMGTGSNPLPGMGFSVILIYVLYFLVSFAQKIALSRASAAREQDTFSAAIGAGLRGALPMLGVALIYLVVGIGAGIVLSLVFAGLAVATQSPAVPFVLGIAMLLGGFYLFARLSLVLPVIAIDGVRNPIAAIGKAWQLTANNSVKIALAWGLVLIAVMVLYAVAFMVTVGIPGPGILAGPTASIAPLMMMVVMGLTVGLYMVTLTTALYEQLSPSSIELTAETFE